MYVKLVIQMDGGLCSGKGNGQPVLSGGSDPFMMPTQCKVYADGKVRKARGPREGGGTKTRCETEWMFLFGYLF